MKNNRIKYFFVFLMMLMWFLLVVSCGVADTSTNISEVDLPKGLYRSVDSFLRQQKYKGIVIMQYDMYCYFNIDDLITSTCYMTDVTTVNSDKVIDAANDNKFKCVPTYLGDNKYHCEVTYTDKFDGTKHEISFDLNVDEYSFILENLTTTEDEGLETFVEGKYRRIQ